MVQSEHIDQLHVHHTSAPAVRWPVRWGVLPARAGWFQARRATEALNSSGTAVVSGMGGAGKTQLAADHAHRLWDNGKLDLLGWITATSRAATLSGLAGLAGALGVDRGAHGEQAADHLLAWLATTPVRWLLVFDDLQSPADLQGWWPPNTPTGHTVVTTRRRDRALAAGRTIISVEPFTPAESLAYLTSALAARPAQADGAAELAHDLGQLPLALAHAAAFVADRPMLTCRSYRTRLADQRTALADCLPDADSLPDDHGWPVAATWSLSVARANELRPVGLAQPVLSVASLLSPNGIPLPVLTAPDILAWLTEAAGHPVSADEVADALAILHRLHLVELDVSSTMPAIRMHALVQRATRDGLSVAGVAEAAAALLAVWPEPERDREFGATLRANAQALDCVAEDQLWHAGLPTVLVRVGRSLGEAGLTRAAADYFRELADRATARLGADHPGTLTAQHYQARFHATAGDITGALPLFEATLASRIRLLGHDHPDTLESRASVVFWRGEAGDPAGAAALLPALIADRTRVLGPDHIDTLTSRANLARSRGKAGDPVGAVAEYAALVADRTRVLGADHPDTLKARRSLAEWRGRAGDAQRAVEELGQLLADRLRLLGPDHRDTLAARASRAYWLSKAGALDAATSAFAAILADRLAILGPDHPATLTTRSNLARCRGEAGDAAGAAAEYAAVLADRLRVHGPDHPRTRLAEQALARWRALADQPG